MVVATSASFALVASVGYGSVPAVAEQATPPSSSEQADIDVVTSRSAQAVNDDANSGESQTNEATTSAPTTPEATSVTPSSPSDGATESTAPAAKATTSPAAGSAEAGDGGLENESSAAAADDLIAPLSVPTPGEGEAVITVKVGGDRSGVSGTIPLAGTVLHLRTGGSSGPSNTRADGVAGDGVGWARCVSDAQGDCSFVVPSTGNGGANRDQQYWVVQHTAPAGFFQNSQLRVGPNSGGGSAQNYTFRTGTQLRAGSVYSSQSTFMVGTGATNLQASGGVWQQSRTNPPAMKKCGLSVALVLDLSGSVQSSGSLAALKAASDELVDALQGTPSRMSLFSFSWISPAQGATQNYPSPVGVTTAAQGTEFKDRYKNWTAAGGTNWDRGFASVAEAAPSYDIAVVITDGNPTVYNSPYENNGVNNRLREIENGIFSANAVKAEGTRVLALGVGAGATGQNTALNLAAVSGQTGYSGGNLTSADYFQLSSYEAAGQALRALAMENCQSTVSVVKQIVPSSTTGEDVSGATPAGAGWTFDASTTTSGVGGLPTSKTTTTDGTGAVSIPFTYPSGVTGIPLEVSERQQPGFSLVTQGGKNAICTNLVTQQPIVVENAGATGFTLATPNQDAVSCTIYNREPAPHADLTPIKKWVVDGVEYENGAQPAGLTAAAYLTGPDGADASFQSWSQPRSGYTAGDTATVSETTTLPSDLCTIDSRVTLVNGRLPDGAPAAGIPLGDGYQTTLVSGANSVQITNNVNCTTELTLTKTVQGGSADPAAWTLTAFTGDDGPVAFSGQAGSSAVTKQRIAGNSLYVLAEGSGDARYAQVDVRERPLRHERSTGSWTCQEIDANGDVVPGFNLGLNGSVSVPLGKRVSCEAVNQTASLTLLKAVVNDDGGTAVASDWDLTATPAGGIDGLQASTVAGGDTASAANTFNVRPEHTYTVSESAGPAGYVKTKLQRLEGSDWTDVEGWDVKVPVLGDATYRIVNDDQPRPWTVKKTSDPVTGSTVRPGDTITYSVTASAADAPGAIRDVVLTDRLDDVLSGADFVSGSAKLTIGSTATDVADPTGERLQTSAFDLPAGSTATLTYQVVVKSDAYGATLRNVVTGTGDVPPTTCPTPEGDDPVTDPQCITTHVTAKWSLSKSSDPEPGAQVVPGATIDYSLTATNTSGNGAVLSGATAADDLGGVLDHATLVSPLPPGLTLNDDGRTLTWAVQTLADGASATTTYQVKVNSDAVGVQVRNLATPGVGGECVPTEGQDVKCETSHSVPTPGFALEKSSDPVTGSTVAPGQVITYTVTVSNTGETVLTPVTVSDDLTGVLVHATFDPGSAKLTVGDAAPVDVADPVDQRFGSGEFELAIGESATLTYRITVNGDAHGVTLKNVATAEATPPGFPPITPPPGETTHNVPPVTPDPDDPGTPGDPGHPHDPGGTVSTYRSYGGGGGLARTGVEVGGLIALAAMAALFGGLMVVGSRRRPKGAESNQSSAQKKN
ncbi:DUF11 domain-containing protein [Pseudoclavibacter sp. CFCC 13796]|uniref:DUF7927 domain-containing protein n=1 Tax=Pseudoclavibacter sp. CFCC 13796 TaxID=2615179 RepID=UPI00130186C6|nr:DUF11 domain-containing protein [Pseudoclavibacter sp. CFCC 13796]KAB1660922.1 DUF11 domain-containing protein [Pseudoclavibacter sp. CFCC 13796]